MNNTEFVLKMQLEFVSVLSGAPASQFRDVESSRSLGKNEKVLGIIKGKKALELRKLIVRLNDFMHDYRAANDIDTPEKVIRLRPSENLDLYDTWYPLNALICAIINMQWVEIFREFPAHYHDGFSLGVREGLQLIRVCNLEAELSISPVVTVDNMPSGYAQALSFQHRF